ncbi:MAG: hypothetical protein QM477_06505 [Planctomycetota bacterium]
MRFLLLLACLTLLPASGGGENPFLEKQLATATRLLEAGKVAEARVQIERALERDDQHLGALRLWASVCAKAGDKDTAAYALHSWLEVVRAAETPSVKRKVIKEVEADLLLIDTEAKSFRKLTDLYIKELLKLEKEHVKRGRFHSALAILDEVLHIDPRNAEGLRLYKAIQREGGSDIATEDIYAGTDPSAGVDPEWIAEENAKHSDWKNAWRKETEYYRIRTNAGYMVLQTAGIAMDQMSLAYRRFFHYKEDGGSVPKIDVLVFKNRDEYLTLGSSPVEWSAGQFTGSAVETYIGDAEGSDGIRGMYSTLFHEAAHQYVSLTGKGGVPGWLNEAYASFFEGTTILSNGTVRWNRVNNGRLFALAPRLEAGWMKDYNDGIRDNEGGWGTPTKAPSLRILIENRYEWGPPWYAPTWGVVYFLYNYRDPETGIPVLRAPLHEYYLSGAGSVGPSRRIEHFEEIVLSGEKSPVKTVDELTEIWAEWLLELRDRQLGKGDAEADLLHYADLAIERNDIELALSLLEEAMLYAPDNPETQWSLANVLEEKKLYDRASSMYRTFASELELRGLAGEDSRYERARKLMEELDPLFQKHKKLKFQLETDGLKLARSYRQRKMPRMAMEIARRMSASWSMPEALAFYTEVAMESGISLARWRIAYNELTLDGWQPNKYYRAYGKIVDVLVVDDPLIKTPPGSFQTQELSADVSFDADYSIETEFRFGKDPSFMGLCFGRKDGRNTHAVGLYPKGALDVATKAGGNWTTRDHQQLSIAPGWHKLKIDVVTQTGANAVVDIYFDDKYLRSVEMPRDSVRGSFGLITGTGDGHFRNIRILERDPHDPAARIEREIALKERLSDPSSRAPGVFQGVKPPDFSKMHGKWLQGEAMTLLDNYGHPSVIAFWTPHQDELIPTTDYYDWLVGKWKEFGLEVVVVVTNSHTEKAVLDWLKEHPMEHVRVLYDQRFLIYPAYNVGQGGWEIPRLLLIDVDGTVAWEGDPNLRLDVGWDLMEPEITPLDQSIEALVNKRQLRELEKLGPSYDAALSLFEKGDLKLALNKLTPLANLKAGFDIRVQDARALRDAIEGIGAELPLAAEAAEEEGRPLFAFALLSRAIDEFPKTGIADLSTSRRRKLERTTQYRKATKAWKSLESAAKDAGRGRDQAQIMANLDKALAASDCAEVQEAAANMRDVLLQSGASAVAAVWEKVQPQTLGLDF